MFITLITLITFLYIIIYFLLLSYYFLITKSNESNENHSNEVGCFWNE